MVRSTVLVAGSLVLVLSLVHLQVTDASDIDDVTRLLMQIDNVLAKFRGKRGCIGYMCSYSHMSSSAGSKAVHNSLMKFLYNCAKDPHCSPGKRKRRSVSETDTPLWSMLRNRDLETFLRRRDIKSLLSGSSSLNKAPS
ncbi:uncharacterized protein LOC101858621 [Aplysia californica]|uniref:Uncharacterized protein LOC101858621 n=1 Tax=Aplysia californica TaxID=6500 RepID=A0ABM0JK94_APLCA|nr:uncharacterized protein LOC101858621 [Aplysia californica]